MDCYLKSFFIPCIPPKTTAQQKGVFVVGGHPRFFKKPSVRQAENFLASLLKDHAPAQPLCIPISVSVRWVFPFRKSEKKSIVKAGKSIPHTVRPDLDNLEKSLLDVMSRLGFWTDDSLICSKRTGKVFGAHPGIHITIQDYGDNAL